MKQKLKQAVQKTYAVGDRLGIHVIPKHYYSPIPDRQWLIENQSLWIQPASLAGLNWDLDSQLVWLRSICEPYYSEVKGFHLLEKCAGTGLGFGPIESQVLHCFLRSTIPSRVIEIGGGVSTCCMLHAISMNERDQRGTTSVSTIEPYPSSFLMSTDEITLIREPCQAVDLNTFRGLAEGDLLFIDSSHAVKVGSDVVRICTEILPALRPGVFIHFHDIFLPYTYPRDTLQKFFGWQETALLLAYLTENPHIEILACMSALFYERTSELAQIATDFVPQASNAGLSAEVSTLRHFPSSLWIRRRNASN